MSGTRDETVSVAVTGPVTRAEVEWWRGAILEAMSRPGPLRIDLAASGPWDVSGLQLLLSVLRTPRKAADSVRLTRVPRVVLAIAERAGVADVFASEDVVESLA